MNVLGIESSCDETAAAVVSETGDAARPWTLRSNVIASQVPIHREWGGVVPELASRQHVRDICGVVERALADAAAGWPDVDAVAVTQGPGLVGSLLVGVSFAKAAAAALGVPLVAVHHLAGHIESLFLHHGPLPLPAVVLVVSGGHTSLYRVPVEGVYEPIARTRDDAAGEAYDKVARLLGLGYPGGPVIDRLAGEGNDRAVDLPVTRITHEDRNAPVVPSAGRRKNAGDERKNAEGGRPNAEGEFGRRLRRRLDFSFSGLKTAVLRHVTARQVALTGGPPGARGPTDPPGLPAGEIADLCASFQRVVVEALLDRTFEAASWLDARSIGIAGGVSANSRLRSEAAARGERLGLPVFLPGLELSTDNAAMIAAAGLRKLAAGRTAGLELNAEPSLGWP
jgi:N6-L-threonylcarbamoyladenine synthase